LQFPHPLFRNLLDFNRGAQVAAILISRLTIFCSAACYSLRAKERRSPRGSSAQLSPELLDKFLCFEGYSGTAAIRLYEGSKLLFGDQLLTSVPRLIAPNVSFLFGVNHKIRRAH